MRVNIPGNYEDLADRLKAETNAPLLVLVVLDGNRGNGVSVRLGEEFEPEDVVKLLREVANKMEQAAQQKRAREN